MFCCRCNLAGGGYADDPAVHITRFAVDDGNYRFAVYADSRLVHHGAKRLQRLHFHHYLDHRVPHDKSAGAEIQAWIKRARRVVATAKSFRCTVPCEPQTERMLTEVC